MAYVLGFFMADGSLDVNPRGSQYFNFHIRDKKLLESIREVMNSEHKIATRKVVGGNSVQYRLQIGSKEMCDDLRSLGVQEQKAHNMKIPSMPRVYFSDFVRGYFDGDGNIWMGKVHKDRGKATNTLMTTFTSCSGEFLKDLKKLLNLEGLSGGSLFFSRKAYRLQYSVMDSIMLYRILYTRCHSTLYLKRKKKIFEEYIKMRW